MAKIRVKNFGPIKSGYQEHDGWIDIQKVTLFIGNQGTGKSTIAKLISTFMWIEKVLTRKDYDKKYFERKEAFRTLLSYHGIESYFRGSPYGLQESNPDVRSEVEYIGNAYSIKLKDRHLIIEENEKSKYDLPQIMYVPSERNYLSTTNDPKQQRQISGPLIELLTEFELAKKQLKEVIALPINKVGLKYDEESDATYIEGTDYTVNLTKSSSGFQSIVPLYLVSRYLANSVKKMAENREPMSSDELSRFRKDVAAIYANTDFTEEQRRAALSVVAAKYNKTAFINIVEEPEQNLFPTSQWEILKSLLSFNNMNAGNKLIMTSHSPYIINYLTLAVKAASVLEKVRNSSKADEFKDKLNEIVPLESVLSSEDLVIYEMDDKGDIIKLDDYKGLPSDENYLNLVLEKSNDLFSKLLDIEDLCL